MHLRLHYHLALCSPSHLASPQPCVTLHDFAQISTLSSLYRDIASLIARLTMKSQTMDQRRVASVGYLTHDNTTCVCCLFGETECNSRSREAVCFRVRSKSYKVLVGHSELREANAGEARTREFATSASPNFMIARFGNTVTAAPFGPVRVRYRPAIAQSASIPSFLCGRRQKPTLHCVRLKETFSPPS
jgi:hypothetical protein